MYKFLVIVFHTAIDQRISLSVLVYVVPQQSLGVRFMAVVLTAGEWNLVKCTETDKI